MSRVRRVAPSVSLICAVVALAIFTRVLVPFSTDDKRVLVPPERSLDATLATLLVAEGVDKLLANPRGFYDTAILHPDRTQLRSTEPFLGFALLAVPLRTVWHLGDVDVFEMLRWLMLCASLVYAFLLFRAAGIDDAVAMAGATTVLCQPSLLIGISRLQLLSIPLILPVLYHALMVWSGRRPRAGHSAALFLWMALYPLCGMINATIGVVAGALLLPLILTIGLELARQKRLRALLAPSLGAVVFDVLVLWPWLVDRADLRVYASPAFLAIKRWTPTLVPLRAEQIPSFIEAPAGLSIAVALAMLWVLMLWCQVSSRRLSPSPAVATERPRGRPTPRTHVWVMVILTLALGVAASYGITRHDRPWLGVLFDLGCVATLLLFWRAQVQASLSGGDLDVARLLTLISAGLGVFLCLVSFGPVYAGNRHPLASGLTTALLEVIPPMKSIREFDRVWMFGIMFLSIYTIVRIGQELRARGPLSRGIAAAILTAAAAATVYNRPLVASPLIEAPSGLVAALAQSPGKGAIYVHPYMKWNARSGVLMIAIARELKRPIVNGYLGISLPWFAYATGVLNRFPDPEALWLLRKWRVATVISLAGDADNQRLEQSPETVQPQDVVIREVPLESDLLHPSETVAGQPHADDRVDGVPFGRIAPRVLGVTVPAGFSVDWVELHLSPTPVAPVPPRIDVYGTEAAERVSLNDGRSGQWLESLAADALVRRERPVATIGLIRPTTGQLELEWGGAAELPVERVVLVGGRRRVPIQSDRGR